jgi:ABC-type transporter Mla subunit MlaD
MPVQDLTPQLRTRLSRVERAVGWFVLVATVLLLAGFSYYVYSTAERKGWFLTKLPYYTYVKSAAGLHVGDPVMLMGFEAGRITLIKPMPPFSVLGNVYVEFVVREPYFGYLWTDSSVNVISAGFLGNRALEVIQGGTTTNKILHPSYDVDKKTGKVLGVWDIYQSNFVAYTPQTKGFAFPNANETPVVTERLEELAMDFRQALPGILDLTNQIGRVLTNAAEMTAHTDALVVQAQPLLTNLQTISAILTNGPGALGDWIIPTNLNAQLQETIASANTTLGTANATLGTANTNVAVLGKSLNASLENLAGITSNLNVQVQRNDQMLTQISTTVVNANNLVQGLKHHWLLRSAFKKDPDKSFLSPPPMAATNAPSAVTLAPPPSQVQQLPSTPPPQPRPEEPARRWGVPTAGSKTGKRITP